MTTELVLVPGQSRCCGGPLWVPRRGISQYWLCGTCQRPCDRDTEEA
jgi:hypothetical protein